MVLDQSQPASRDALPVLWICGAPGAGKSAIGWSLFERVAGQGATVAYLDIDQLGMLYPDSDEDPDGFRLKTDALNAVIPNYMAFGAQALIVSGILDPGAPADLASQYPSARMSFCLLDTDDATLRERILQRGWNSEAVEQAVAEAMLLRESAFVDASIDTIGASVEEVAESARRMMSIRESDHLAVGRAPARSAANADLVVITGPRAVGTSTIGYGLANTLWNGGITTGFADLDQLALLRTDDAGGNTSTPLGASNVAAIHEVFAGHGATRLIISSHLRGTSEHELIRAAVPDGRVTVVRLKANDETIAGHVRERTRGSAARLAGDDLTNASLNQQAEVIRQARVQQEGLDAQADEDILIDVTAQLVDTVINEVASALMSDRERPHLARSARPLVDRRTKHP